jgi:hypothetical protein
MKHTRERTRIALAVGLLVVGVAAHRAEARSITINQSLAATGVDPNANGQVQARIAKPRSGMRAKLALKARGLDPKASYTVLLNGVPVGTLSTTPAGNARVQFSSQPRQKDQLLGVDPRGAQIEVRNDNGDDVLDANMPATGMDPTKVQCCIAQSGDSSQQPECEDLTPDACTAAGGVDSGATSCLPNPCEGATPPPPQDNVVCCIPEEDGVTNDEGGVSDNGAGCEMRSAASCSQHHGIQLAATSCDPNPCTSTTPANPDTVQCCVTDEGETECKQRTLDRCNAQGGTSMGAGSCSPNPCPSTSPADQVRCCLPNDSGGTECEQRTLDQCTTQGGMSAGPGTCDASTCATNPPSTSGDQIRCCIPHSGRDSAGPECEQRTLDQCTSQGGTSKGQGSCDPNPCG